MNPKTLIAYFSYSGTTAEMARAISERTGGDLFEILPARPYAKSYNACVSEAKLEKGREARPLLAENLPEEKLAAYDTIFVGYPIWWYDAPMILYTFLESHDWKGKTVVPFATSGGSGFSGSEEKIAEITGADVKKGLLLRGAASQERIDEWLKSVGA